MGQSVKSVLVFGIYLALLGLTLVFIPNTLLGLFGFPQTNEIWIRVAGVLILALSYYFIQAARSGTTGFFRSTIVVRVCVFLIFSSFALLRLVQPTIILLGVVDLAGATWTVLALRKETS